MEKCGFLRLLCEFSLIPMQNMIYLGSVFFQLPTHPDSGSFSRALRHFSLGIRQYSCEKCLAQRKIPRCRSHWEFSDTPRENTPFRPGCAGDSAFEVFHEASQANKADHFRGARTGYPRPARETHPTFCCCLCFRLILLLSVLQYIPVTQADLLVLYRAAGAGNALALFFSTI